jgi:hypothetical protein
MTEKQRGGDRHGALHVRILASEGCANAAATVDLVKEVSRIAGLSVTTETLLVASLEQAKELRFLGSPTVQLKEWILNLLPETAKRLVWRDEVTGRRARLLKT